MMTRHIKNKKELEEMLLQNLEHHIDKGNIPEEEGIEYLKELRKKAQKDGFIEVK